MEQARLLTDDTRLRKLVVLSTNVPCAILRPLTPPKPVRGPRFPALNKTPYTPIPNNSTEPKRSSRKLLQTHYTPKSKIFKLMEGKPRSRPEVGGSALGDVSPDRKRRLLSEPLGLSVCCSDIQCSVPNFEPQDVNYPSQARGPKP